MFRIISIIFLLVTSIELVAQVSIVRDEFNGTEYFSSFEINTEVVKSYYSNKMEIKENLIHSAEDPFLIRLILAIPANSKPIFSYKIIDSDDIESNNSLIEVFNNFFEFNTNFKVKGYFWLNGNYVAHIEINPIIYIKNQFKLIKQFSITYKLSNLNLNKAISNSNLLNLNLSISNLKSARMLYQANHVKMVPTTDWIDWNNSYIKLGVTSDDVYRLVPEDLTKLKIDLNGIDPKTFKLFLKGNELPIFIKGEEDKNFDNGDYIEFVGVKNLTNKHRILNKVGEPYNEYRDRYSDTTVYWLTWGGDFGKRVEVQSGIEPVNDTLKYYYEVLHDEKDIVLDYSYNSLVKREFPQWNENQTWHGGLLNVGLRTIRFSTNNIYPNTPFYVYSKLQDFASDISDNSHLLGLQLKGANEIYDSTYISKYQKIILSFEANSSILNAGTNDIYLHSFPTNASINSCLFDWTEIEYPKYLKAFEDSLLFAFPHLSEEKKYYVKIDNIQSNSNIIWKYGNEFKKYFVETLNNTIAFTDSVNFSNKFLLTSSQKIKRPIIFYNKKFRNLKNIESPIDYIAITHSKFFSDVNKYADFISSNYDLSTIVINVDDIYDEYSFGFFNPEAIKDFLKSANSNWQEPKPKYVFLIGGATYDYHHNKEIYGGFPRVNNYVPSFGAPVSDNWFVIWDSTGANIPQMNIGRLPITKVEELDRYFQRHKKYLNQEFDEWNKNYIFFTGGKGDSQAELDLLRNTNDFIITEYTSPPPIGGNVNHFYKTINPITNFGPFDQPYVQQTIDNGAVFISYIGHSGTRTWDNSITEPEQLSNNKDRAPLVTDYGCSTAKFAEPDIISYSELFVTSEKSQGIAYIGNSSLGFISTATNFPKLFYKKILADSIFQISEALNQAKIELLQNFGSTEVNQLFVYSNTLIGDPIISLSIPLKANLSISPKKVMIKNTSINDASDSIDIAVVYNNYGRVFNDNININITDEYNDQIIYEKKFIRKIPNFVDSLLIKLPIKNKPGKHQLKLLIDAENKVDEIYEDDNLVVYDFIVASSSTRTLMNYAIENAIDSGLIVLNPTSKTESEKLDYNISDNQDFKLFSSFSIKTDTFFTKLKLESLEKNKRYWIRTKLENENDFGLVKSFVRYPKSNYLIIDSFSVANAEKSNIIFINNLNLDTNSTILSVSSAGFYDGRSALIFKNDKNYVPENFKTGHHVGLFDKFNYRFKEYKYFNTYSGGSSVINEYKTFLDSLSEDNLIFVAISDDGRISDPELRTKLHNIGSQYIDSLQFRSSWAIIGHKGAIQGSVPEAFSNPTQGPVKVDTSFSEQFSEGTFITAQIGPSTNWKNLSVQDSLPNNSKITYKPILISQTDNIEDTLSALNMVNGEALLSHIDAKKYPYIKILAEFKAGDNNTSPSLKSLGVDYDGVPELATNYQVVSVEKDTVQQGEDANLQFYVYNVGESSADSFKVKVEVIKPDNSKEKIFEEVVDSIGSEKRKKFNIVYPTTNFNGPRTFSISIDTEEKVDELFEDNNFYNIPFYVVGDTTKPSINLTFDGNDIFDGEYISNQPQIKVELSDPSLVPITDTSSISIYLNNKYIKYFNNENNLKINYSSTNPKVIVDYTPTLEDGEYTLRVFGKDASGNVGDSSGITKIFNVVTDAKLLQVYNYPNPFSNDTYFTFKLTQIPDEIKIKIFTVAGRLIKEIILNGAELNYDLNKIYWDGRDEDGDLIGNGVYLYKVIMDVEGKKQDITQKLAIVR